MNKTVIKPAWDAGTPAVRVSRHRSDMTVVTVKGPLDQSAVRALERVLWQDRTPRLIVDLSGVPELTPAAADTISRAHMRARAEQRRFSVVVPQRAAAKVLAATHAGPALMRFLTLSDAMRETPPVGLR